MIEANVIRTLDEAEDFIVDFDVEQFIIPYPFKGATLNYVPDVILKTRNGSIFVIEVKPSSKKELTNEKNVAKWDRAKVWCWNRGVRFLVITDKDWPQLIKILQLLEDKNIQEAQSLMTWNMLTGN